MCYSYSTRRDVSRLRIAVITRKNNEDAQPFVAEAKYDLLLDKDQKYLILESGRKEVLKILVFENNHPSNNANMHVILETYENERCPTVARRTESEAISANVSVTCYIQAHDLEHSRAIDDPVTGFDPGSKKIRGKISGDLPWDRYYGNYVSVKKAKIKTLFKQLLSYN